MSNGRKVTKSDILNGSFARRERVMVPEWDDSYVEIISLTEGQWADVEAIRMRGFHMDVANIDIDRKKRKLHKLGETPEPETTSGSAGMKMNMEELTRADHIADAQAVAYALTHSGETWSLDDVLAMRPASVVKMIAERVYAISEVKPEDLAEMSTFRSNSGVGATGVSRAEWLPAHDYTSGADVTPAIVALDGTS